VLDHVRDVGELLLEVAAVVLEPLEQVEAVRERAAEMDPPMPMPVPVSVAASVVAVVVVHRHLLSS
jgi:hypothetical protein